MVKIGTFKKINKKVKITVLIILAVVVFLITKLVYVVENSISEINKNYANLTIVYSKNNGSLPPPYHREYVFTISTDGAGNIKGESTIRDYDKVIEKTPFVVSREQLNKVITASAEIHPESNDSVNLGCTGGSATSIRISQSNKMLLATSAYNCAGRSTNNSLERFSAKVEDIVPSSK